ncbi:MAG: precorrin-3B C(17)-methyltransferase [Thermodesulfovibrionales bacterium]|nr:precorrin-3B C(17)-methyltransferase [Thermodesulfovibrionales bacterium]
MGTTIFFITNNGYTIANKIKDTLKESSIFKYDADLIKQAWQKRERLIFIMSAGIVVRTIAQLIKDKKTDPPVLVIDEKGEFVISLLSGHIGGANEFAKEIAKILNAEAVITTSSDLNNLTTLDLWLKDKRLFIENPELLPQVMTRFIKNAVLRVYVDEGLDIDLPDDFLRVKEAFADLLITNKAEFNICGCKVKGQIIARPKNLFVGIGCNSGTTIEEIENAVISLFNENNLSMNSVSAFATIDIKQEEKGIKEFINKYSFPLISFNANELNSVKGIEISYAALKSTGAKAVAEPSAILSSNQGNLIVSKKKIGNLTLAIAQSREINRLITKPTLYIVGTGPGDIIYMTEDSLKAIKEASIIIGYDTYIEHIKVLLKDKEIFTTTMTKEKERCKKAIELARMGNTVALISGGDPGIYAMAGLVFEILHNLNLNSRNIDVKVIPGVSALNACASRVGAPLMHDFACISLSDRLTPWELIEKRLDKSAEADFVIVLYNPKSMSRQEHIKIAREIILKHRSLNTPVGIVRGAMRENESITITNLDNLLNHEIDMQTTIIVGNSHTFVWDKWMITPRGYTLKDSHE